jgi:type IV pilus assembly protein PilE
MPDPTRPLNPGFDCTRQFVAARLASPRRVGAGHTAGFTLVELVTVVAIIAVLAAIALPGYQQYIARANRTAAQSLMLDLANREHQYFAANRTYATSAQLGFAMPADVTLYYTAAIALVAGPPPGFAITFTPVAGSAMATDGTLMLDGAGKKTPADKWLK